MKPPVVVVYKKPRGRKYFMKIFSNIAVDDIINLNKRKPPIPHEFELVEIGCGEQFIEEYKEMYNIKDIEDETT